jgi:hypothetical protein
MAFRNISNAGRLINVTKIPSMEMERNIWTESILERDLAIRALYDSDVLSIREQAIRVFYTLDGKRRSYTPDFLIERKNHRPQIIEVKYKRQLTPWFQLLFRIITPICDRHGYEFLVYTESEIRIQPLLDDIKLLRRYARIPLYPYHEILCHEFFSNKAVASLQELYEFFAGKQVDKQVVLALLYHGILATDHSIPLGVNSPIHYH